MNDILDSPAALLLGAVIFALIVLLGRRVEIQWGGLHAELRPNGGKSVKDRVDRVDRNMFVIATHLGIAHQLEPPPERRANPAVPPPVASAPAPVPPAPAPAVPDTVEVIVKHADQNEEHA